VAALVLVAGAVSIAGASPVPSATEPNLIEDLREPGRFEPIGPFRLLDSRTGLGMPLGAMRKLAQGETLLIPMIGTFDDGHVIPPSANAVVVNMTYVDASSDGYLTTYPTGAPVPNTSNLNVVGSGPGSNLVFAQPGAYGLISVFNAAGSLHLIVDVQGYFVPPDSACANPTPGANLVGCVLVGWDAPSTLPLAPVRTLYGQTKYDLRGINLDGANLVGATLNDVDFSSSTMRGVNLAATTIMGAAFVGADLEAANLAGLEMAFSTLAGANLRGANLRGAEMGYVTVDDTDLTGADLTGAQIGIVYLETALTCGTTMPDGTIDNADC
jgi:hypothetical protein